MNNNSATLIKLGLELGIDNFLFKPFDAACILQKIRLLLKKISAYTAFDKKRFEILFEQSPNPKLVVYEKQIEKANKAFLKIAGTCETQLADMELPDLFELNEKVHENESLEFCLKGFKDKCVVRNVRLKNTEIVVDMHVSHIRNLSSNRSIIQLTTVDEKPGIRLRSQLNEQSANTQQNSAQHGTTELLTSREVEVVKLSAQGFQIKEIATELQISKRTVEKHRANVMRKTNTTNIVEAIGKLYGISEFN